MSVLLQRISRVADIDRRYIFLALAAAVVLPFLAPVDFEATPSLETQRFLEALDRTIASKKPVVVELAFGNQTMSEMEPIALALMHKLFHDKKQVIFLTTYESAAAFTRRYLAIMEKEYGIRYGRDYAFLGYAAAYTVAMYKMGTSIEEVYHSDDRGTPLAKLPIMQGVASLKDVSAVIDVAANSNPLHWINYVVTPFQVDFLVASTAVQATDYFPFLQTGHIKGLIAGGRAGAELETILVDRGVMKRTGDSTRALGSQSLALLMILGFIVLGNVGYLARRLASRERAP